MSGPTPDPHAPITNIDRGPVEHERLLSPPTPGQVEGAPPARDGVEALAPAVRPESGTAMTAPDVVLPDVGLASFADPGVTLETVHGRDDRIPVKDTQLYPWSATASLLITAADGSQWVGTG